MSLTDFPVDDFTLDQLEHAMGGAFTIDENGDHVLVGAEFTVTQLLDFLAGVDPDNCTFAGYTPDGMPVYDHHDVHYHEHDVIRALIAEVRRLRSAVDA